MKKKICVAMLVLPVFAGIVMLLDWMELKSNIMILQAQTVELENQLNESDQNVHGETQKILENMITSLEDRQNEKIDRASANNLIRLKNKFKELKRAQSSEVDRLQMKILQRENREDKIVVLNLTTARLGIYSTNDDGKIRLESVRYINEDLKQIWEWRNHPSSPTVREIKAINDRAKEERNK